MKDTIEVSRRWLARHICLGCLVLVEADGEEWVHIYAIRNTGELFKGRNSKGAEVWFKPDAILQVRDIEDATDQANQAEHAKEQG
jgi:hypothetical protein